MKFSSFFLILCIASHISAMHQLDPDNQDGKLDKNIIINMPTTQELATLYSKQQYIIEKLQDLNHKIQTMSAERRVLQGFNVTSCICSVGAFMFLLILFAMRQTQLSNTSQ